MRPEVIYVACPAHYATGGTELLHQLVHHLRTRHGYAAFILYTDVGKEPGRPPTPERFLPYVGENWVSEAPDLPGNLLVIPESNLRLSFAFQQVTKVIWWLSVDSFLRPYGEEPYAPSLRRRLLHGLKARLRLGPYAALARCAADPRVALHLFQSEYARTFLVRHGLAPLAPLSDYLGPAFLRADEAPAPARQDVVLYNPRKGFEFTRELIAHSPPGIDWRALENQPPAALRDLMRTAKAYVDFGNHPGKDRMPREAAVNGCCIVTNRRGAAGNEKDVPIPERYKHRTFARRTILRQLQDIMANYPAHHAAFAGYRAFIHGEESQFARDCAAFVARLDGRPRDAGA